MAERDHNHGHGRRSASAASGNVSAMNGVTKTTPRKKSVACRRCHARKIKCSGELPCQGCITLGESDSCSYIIKDRVVKVSESYLQRLLEGNELVEQNKSDPPPTVTRPSIQDLAESPAEKGVVNPLIEDRAWFEPYTITDLPVYVGEAACTAFTTRLRQALDISSGQAAHIPRFHFISDEYVVADSNSTPLWPSKVKAQLYVKVALAYVGKIYHIILTSVTLKRLDQVYQDMSCVTAVDTCKFFALFALGEVYSNKTKTADSQAIPGLSFFTAASKLLQTLPERATVQHVENLVLLSFFSHILNRRHSAYHYIGSALSLSMTLGLHHKLPNTIDIDPVVRQHRIRLWWTIYYCDRVWGSKLGHPATIQDSTISVDLPSMSGLNNKQKEDFSDFEYAIATIKLARIVSDTIARIYSRNQTEPFIRSVRSILRDLKEWMANLPIILKLQQTDMSTFAPRNISAIHLSFNQCVILATRPVLLHVLKQSLVTSSAPDMHQPQPPTITPTISALAETCIHTARHSSDILTQAWINGTLTTFGYFDAHYLFSSAVVLAISSLLNPTSSDGGVFDMMSQILKTMAENGNLSAAEFSGHLDCVYTSITLYQDQALNANVGEGAKRGDEVLVRAQLSTTEMALGETSMQDFLLQADSGEFDFLNPLVGFEEASFLDPGWTADAAQYQV